MKRMEVNLRFTEPCLGSAPANPEVYQQYIAARKRNDAEAAGEEVLTLPAEEREVVGRSVFHRDDQGVFIFDYHIKGFLKEAASAVTGKALTAYKSKIDKWLFVFPRKLYFERDGARLAKPDGMCERPIRAMTAQGPRVSLKSSEIVFPGSTLTFQLAVMPLGEDAFTPKVLESWLAYGELMGLGEWRGGSNGRFVVEKFA